MTFGAIFSLALGLAMDATAVAAARGLAAPRILPRHVLLVAGLFGGFQALMPFLGWIVGSRLGPLIQAWDHWVAFGLLGAIGGKMLWEARPEPAASEEPRLPEPRPAGAAEEASSLDALFGVKALIVLAIATSIDALAVGITLPMLGAPFALSLVTIGVTAAVASAAGLLLGRRFGSALGKRLDVLGGLVLVGLGLKILFEHLSAG